MERTNPLRVLNPEQLDHWKTWGHVLVEDVMPRENCERLLDFLFEFEEMDRDDPSTWYRPQQRKHRLSELNNTGMVEAYNHQYLWDNRQLPAIYDVFVDIWDDTELWVSIDRANLNPPNKGGRAFEQFIHWDVDTSLDPIPFKVQGTVALVDHDAEIGGIQIIPELFHDLPEWIKTQPADRDPLHPDITGYEPRHVSMKAGDLFIFNGALPHGVLPNVSADRFRAVQYITMFPAQEEDTEQLNGRIASWRDRIAKDQLTPDSPYFDCDPRQWEATRYERAELTPHGMRLLGTRSWRDPAD